MYLIGERWHIYVLLLLEAQNGCDAMRCCLQSAGSQASQRNLWLGFSSRYTYRLSQIQSKNYDPEILKLENRKNPLRFPTTHYIDQPIMLSFLQFKRCRNCSKIDENSSTRFYYIIIFVKTGSNSSSPPLDQRVPFTGLFTSNSTRAGRRMGKIRALWWWLTIPVPEVLTKVSTWQLRPTDWRPWWPHNKYLTGIKVATVVVLQ